MPNPVKPAAPSVWVTFVTVASVMLQAATATAQAPKEVVGIDFLNERLPLPETERYDEGEYIDTGVGLVFGVEKRLSYYAGQYEEAVVSFEELIRRFRFKSEIWVYLARSYFYMKSPEKARQTLERAQEVMPDLAERLWQPMIASMLAEIRRRANQQQVQVDFYSPDQQDFLSLFRLYLFLQDHKSAAGVIRSAEGRAIKMRGQATAVSGSSRESYIKEAAKWQTLAGKLRAELADRGVVVPENGLLLQAGAQDIISPADDSDAEKQRILQLKIDYYNATKDEFDELFRLYLQKDMKDRAAAVLAGLQREIGREQIRASVAPTVQDEVEIQAKIEELKALERNFKSAMGTAEEESRTGR